MANRSNERVVPRNGHTGVVGIVARISGCQNQKELSLDDQIDHAKEEVAAIYDGPIEFRTISTKGKGERLDRPELAQVEEMIRSRELDLLVMEDVGRLVRGVAAARLWGIAVDHGVRCLAPNDCLDTADESWEEELLSACRDHVGHNSHTSKRLKKKLMNRFKKFGGATALPIADYEVPESAKSYEDWIKVDSSTAVIAQGLRLLQETLNCSAVADYFNSQSFPPGPYCRRKDWNGPMVRRYFRNRLLAGHPGRGFRHTVKHNESGRRISVVNSEAEPHFLEIPHLAHVDAVELDEVNRLLDEKNGKLGRKKVNGVDPRYQVPRTRSRFPGQYARCWYCGHHFVWGANGMLRNLMCANSRHWRCWNSIGFNGDLAARRIVEAITSELYQLDQFDEQFAALVQAANQRSSRGSADRWQRLLQSEEALAREKDHLLTAILKYGDRPMFEDKLKELDAEDADIRRERRCLESVRDRELVLPPDIRQLRQPLEEELTRLTIESMEFGLLLQQLVPEFYVYLVWLCDGGHLLPRARIKLNLAGHVADARHVPAVGEMLTRAVTLDLFERPPQRERIRGDVVRLAATGMTQREIALQLEDERPKQPVIQQALALERQMVEQGLASPYILLTEPPSDYSRLRRHKNAKYRFEPLEGYVPPPLP